MGSYHQGHHWGEQTRAAPPLAPLDRMEGVAAGSSGPLVERQECPPSNLLLQEGAGRSSPLMTPFFTAADANSLQA